MVTALKFFLTNDTGSKDEEEEDESDAEEKKEKCKKMSIMLRTAGVREIVLAAHLVEIIVQQ